MPGEDTRYELLSGDDFLFSRGFLLNSLKRSPFKMVTMRLSEFILLNDQEKTSTVLHRGVQS